MEPGLVCPSPHAMPALYGPTPPEKCATTAEKPAPSTAQQSEVVVTTIGCWNSYAPWSTATPEMRGRPSRSVAGSDGALLLPASIAGDVPCKWKSPAAKNLGSAEMLPLVPTTCEQLPCVAGPAELKRSLWSKTGGVDEYVVSQRTAGIVVAAATMLLTS